jgi:hypothetical protein
LKTTHSGKLLFSTVFLLVILFGVFPANVHAWGSRGHQIIARIADQRLSSRARKGVTDLLGGQSLEAASTWADLNRSPQTFHFVSIPFGSKGYERGRDCPQDNCLIEKIKHYRDILQDPKESTPRRAEALKYVLHFIGDLHQPLHCADNNDANGNRFKVIFDKKPSNLHKVWDTDMIEIAGLTAEQYSRQLGNTRNVEQSSLSISRGTIVDWALESQSFARRAYDQAREQSGQDFVNDYYKWNKQTVDGQLYRAGVRLASILNDVFR